MTEQPASATSSYAAAGVDTAAGDLAVELMKSAVSRTHGPEVLGGVGGFAGLFDVSALSAFDRPLLATSTDGVGTKVAIAQAIDKHDTIGQDLVGMVVDDIVVVGAKPLFMTDYIACGKVVPERIADIVARHRPGVRRDRHRARRRRDRRASRDSSAPTTTTSPARRSAPSRRMRCSAPTASRDGDVVVALASSGLHSNGFSLVRHILAERGIGYTDSLRRLRRRRRRGAARADPPLHQPSAARRSAIPRSRGAVHALSHVTGGGIAANLARVLPLGSLGRGRPLDLVAASGVPRARATSPARPSSRSEGTWNLGIGMFAVVAAGGSAMPRHRARSRPTASPRGRSARSSTSARDLAGFEQGAKGVDGGAVRLVGSYAG